MNIEVMKQALEALEIGLDYAESELYKNRRRYEGYMHLAPDDQAYVNQIKEAITSLRQAIEQAEKLEPGAPMPSNTRYTVEVEGQARTYWDNIHAAITNAQRAVYASVDATTRAIDDLKAGRMAEWSYGFSAVRIYPPHNYTTPQPQQAEKQEPVALKPCRSPYCECDVGKCTHPGFYDARGQQ